MVESNQSRINYKLNQLIVESTYGCKVKEGQSQKSKKVKNPADCRTLALYQAKVPIRQAPGGAVWVAVWASMGIYYARASWKAGAGSWKASWKLGAGSWYKEKRAGASRELGGQAECNSLTIKHSLNKTYVHYV